MEISEALRTFAGLLSAPPDKNFTDPLFHELLQRGIVAALEDLASETAAEVPASDSKSRDENLSPTSLLYRTASIHVNETIREQAFRSLIRLAQSGLQPAIDSIYQLAVEEDLLAARQILLTNDWSPSRPALGALFTWFSNLAEGKNFPQSKLEWITRAYFEDASPSLRKRMQATAAQIAMENWSRITAALEESQSKDSSCQSLQNLVAFYPSCSPEERQLMLNWLEHYAQEGSQPAREAISLLFIQHEDPSARRTALEQGYAPKDPEQRALFFFLAEAWESYDTLDFNHNLLVNAYDRANRTLRRRLLEHSRYTGRMDWLRGMNAPGELRWIGDLTDADWELAIRRLQQVGNYPDLWRLSHVAPPVWSAAVLDLLAQGDWKPDREEDRAEFSDLVILARESLDKPLSIQPQKNLHAPADSLNCLAIQPSGEQLAGGSSDQRVFIWELPQGDLRVPPLFGPNPVIRSLAISQNGELLASASSDHRIRIFRLQGGQVIKTLEGHKAMIRALAIDPGDRLLYSASFDGSIRAWRFPYGPELKTMNPGSGEIFSMALSKDGRYLFSGGSGGQVQVWAQPEGILARELSGHQDTITHIAASPTGDLVASAGRDGVIQVWNFTSGNLVRTIENPDDPLTALAIHPNEQVLIGGGGRGIMTLWSLSTGRAIDRLIGHENMITGLALSPTGDTLYSSDAVGKLFVWDLRTFLTIRLPDETSRPGAAAALQERLKHPSLPQAEKKWLTFAAALARWRQRYDIELGEPSTISVGEFDIEIT